MMRSTPPILFTALLSACTPDPQPANEEVRAQVEGTMNAFAAMDLEGFMAGLENDAMAFEMDLEGKPLRLGSREEVVRFAGEIFAEMERMGAKMTLVVRSIDCRSDRKLATCTVEFDLDVMMPDGSMMSQPTRNTVVLRKADDGWRWTHWHSSLAVASPPSGSSGSNPDP